MPNTTKGLPYPLPTDPVSLGANNIRALAEAVDPKVLPADTVIAAATRIISNLLAAGGQPAWRVLGNGKQEWGNGTGAPDANLYRSVANVLSSDGDLEARTSVPANKVRIGYHPLQNGAGIQLNDATLTRDLYVGYPGVKCTYMLTSTYRVVADVGRPGQVEVGEQAVGAGIRFGIDYDTNVYRSAVGTLKTDGHLIAGGDVATLGASGSSFLARGKNSNAVPLLVGNVLGDTTDRLNLYTDRLEFGPGGTAVTDTRISRLNPGVIAIGAGFGRSVVSIGQLAAGGLPGSAGDFALQIASTAAVPVVPQGGGVLYVSGGALKYMGTSGTVTQLAPA